jgi:hypothetical protein
MKHDQSVPKTHSCFPKRQGPCRFSLSTSHVPTEKANVDFAHHPNHFATFWYLIIPFYRWTSGLRIFYSYHHQQPSPSLPSRRRAPTESRRQIFWSPPFQALTSARRDLDQTSETGSSALSRIPRIAASTSKTSPGSPEPALLHGLSIQSGNVFAKSDPPDCPLRDQPLSTPVTSWCKPKHQQPHRVEFPDQDRCRAGLSASEHHQGREGREVAATAEGESELARSPLPCDCVDVTFC